MARLPKQDDEILEFSAERKKEIYFETKKKIKVLNVLIELIELMEPSLRDMKEEE